MTRNTLAARNNEAYGQGNGRQSFRTVFRYHWKTLDTGILLLAVFTLELEMDYPSETRDFIVSWSEISLWTVAPSPQTTLLRFFLRGGGGGLYTGYLERILPSWNCPSKLTGKVRRIVHSKLKLFQFQIKKYYLSDTNHQTDNPSHTSNTSLVWTRHFCYKWMSRPGLELDVCVFAFAFSQDYFLFDYWHFYV